MTKSFSMGSYTRKVLAAMVEAIVPPQLLEDPELVGETVAKIEALVGRYPPMTRLGIVMVIQMVQWTGPLFLVGVLPFTFLSREQGTARIRKILKHKAWFFRMAVKYLRIVICLTVFSRPEVEVQFGVQRRAWRENRQSLRAALVQIDEQRADPPIPEPLGGAPLRTESTYLDDSAFGHAREAQPNDQSKSRP